MFNIDGFNNDRNFTGMMLNEYGEAPLLNREEEIGLFTERDQYRALLDDPITDEQTRLWAETELKRVRDHLIRANCRLVSSVAAKYQYSPVLFRDLIQEGIKGLIKAVDKFDLSTKNRLSTYAYWWIKQAITRAIGDQSRTIRIPIHRHDLVKKARRIMNEFASMNGRDPTAPELADSLDLPVKTVQQILVDMQPILSLDVFNTDNPGDEPALYAVVADDCNIEGEADISLLSEMFGEILLKFDNRSAKIIRLRFGLDGEKQHTLAEVGEKFGLTRERVRQIEAAALTKLRHPCRSRRLRPFLEAG